MKTFLFDRDNLQQVFTGRRGKELLEKYTYRTLHDLYTALIDKKSLGAKYIVGLPGTGKTNLAMNHLGAQKITKTNILDLLTMEFDDMVFVTCEVEDEIAKNASEITLVHTSPERLGLQRKLRDKAIQENQSETAFGRKSGTVSRVTTDDSIFISILKTDYEYKSRILEYKSNDPTNYDTIQYTHMSDISDHIKYIERGAVAGSGGYNPFHNIHHDYQFEKISSLAQEKSLEAFLVIGKKESGAYDFALTQEERIKLINIQLKGKLPIYTSMPKFIKNKQGEIIKLSGKGIAILGKDRLPEGFIEGSYDDLLRTYPAFMASKKAFPVNAFAGYHFMNMGNILMEGFPKSVSSSFIRQCLVEGNIDYIKPYLPLEVFVVLTSPHNLKVIQNRHFLLQERNQKIKEKKDELTKKYKYIDPVTHLPLLNKQGKLTKLTRDILYKYETRRDKAKIMTYIQNMEHIFKTAERTIEKKYNKLIYSPENTLNF